MKSVVRTREVMWYCWRRPLTWMGPLAWTRQKLLRSGLGTGRSEERSARGRAAAIKWCANRALDREELSQVLRFEFALEDIEELFPDRLSAANAAFQDCPVNFGGAGPMDLLYSVASPIDARRVLETGVAFGSSSLALLLATRESGEEHASFWSMDFLHFSVCDRRRIGAAVPRSLRPRWHLITAADRQGLSGALGHCSPLDLAHYDSDETLGGRFFGVRANVGGAAARGTARVRRRCRQLCTQDICGGRWALACDCPLGWQVPGYTCKIGKRARERV